MVIRDQRDPNNFVMLTPGDEAPYDFLHVDVSADGFTGKHDQVWFERDEMLGFVAALRQMERVRQGEAELRSFSPDEFRLRLFVADALGALAVEGELRHQSYGFPAGLGCGMAFVFRVSGEYLLSILRGFEAFAQGYLGPAPRANAR